MILEAIRQAVDRENLTASKAHEVMHEMISGAATQSQIASFVTAMRMKGETEEELLGFVTAMRENAVRIIAPEGAVDLCGTGGDGSGSFNISTVSSFVVAAAGVPVAKHGNRAVSSRSGSADLLSALGIPHDLDPATVEMCLRTTGLGFMFAPIFHRSMRNVLGPRREIGIRTFFNVLGPMTNPAGVKLQLIGVYDPALGRIVARVLRDLGTYRAMVVNGEGMDELTNLGKTKVVELIDDRIKEYDVCPEALGIDVAEPEDLRGGSPIENARAAISILKGENSHRTDVVALNSAAALYISGRSSSLDEGLELARETIRSGRALAKLKDFCSFANGMEMERQLRQDITELMGRRIATEVVTARCLDLHRYLVAKISKLDGGRAALEGLDHDLLAEPSALSVFVLNRTRQILEEDAFGMEQMQRRRRSLFEAIYSMPGVSIIAEFKATYPSAPQLHLSPDPVRVAEAYSAAGVAGVSVLLERDFFGGSPDLFSIFRSKLSCPMLLKDFVATSGQIELARRLGADAVLLIAKTLRAETLETFIEACVTAGMEPLVELHDIKDFEKLSSCRGEDSVRLVGINRRDLTTLRLKSLDSSRILRDLIGGDRMIIAESGVGNPRDVNALRGFDAALIGSMFMEAEDLEMTILEAVSCGRGVGK